MVTLPGKRHPDRAEPDRAEPDRAEPDRSEPDPAEPHRAREMAESFGADAERYDRARAAYPAEMIRRIVADAPGRRFLDVGCGTGIEGRQLTGEGGAVLGADPDARMAEVARRSFPVEVSAFEAWTPAGRTFDAVVSGM